MPFHPIRPPRPGTLDHAAYRIYRMLEREERPKKRSRNGAGTGMDGPGSQAQLKTADSGGASPEHVSRAVSGIDEQRLEQREMRRRTERSTAPSERPLEPVTDYGLGAWLGDKLSGVTPDDYEDYVGAKASTSQMHRPTGTRTPRGQADRTGSPVICLMDTAIATAARLMP